MSSPRNRRITPFLWAAFAFLTPLVFASSVMGQGRGMAGKGMPNYDPSTEITFEGTVDEVKEMPCPMGKRGNQGTHLIVKSGGETLDVHLGPSSFLADEKFAFAQGDPIVVIGSKVKFDGALALIAREVKVNDRTLTLRDAAGVPQWSRGGRRP